MRPFLRFFKDWALSKKMLGQNNVLTDLVQVDVLLQQLISEKRVPGLAISVLKKGETIFQKGYGYANLETKEPVHPTGTILRIASISKNIAAAALARMVANGDLDLDASLYTYVPYFPKKRWDFTLRQLAGHTAGIRGYQGKEYGLNRRMSVKEGMALFAEDALVFEPGTDYLYTSFGWNLIALAMEEVSGMPFAAHVRQQVLEPLEMHDTYAPQEMTPELSGRLSSFYSKRGNKLREAILVDNVYKLAGGGYLSTASDISKFGNALLQDSFLPKEIRTEFLSAQNANGRLTYYGLGWQVSQDAKGRPFFGHVGNGVGGYSNLFVYPEQQLVFAVLINCTDPKVQDVLDQILDVLLTPHQTGKGV